MFALNHETHSNPIVCVSNFTIESLQSAWIEQEHYIKRASLWSRIQVSLYISIPISISGSHYFSLAHSLSIHRSINSINNKGAIYVELDSRSTALSIRRNNLEVADWSCSQWTDINNTVFHYIGDGHSKLFRLTKLGAIPFLRAAETISISIYLYSFHATRCSWAY